MAHPPYALFERAKAKVVVVEDIDLPDHAEWPRFVANYRIGVERDPGSSGESNWKNRRGMAADSGGLQGGVDERVCEARLPAAGVGEVGLEAVAEGHQFIDFGDDAVLFDLRR